MVKETIPEDQKNTICPLLSSIQLVPHKIKIPTTFGAFDDGIEYKGQAAKSLCMQELCALYINDDKKCGLLK